MMTHLRYLWAVLRHKWYVFVAGVRIGGIPLWRLIIHDWTKFTGAEWGPYARRFGQGTSGTLNHATEPAEWQAAWRHHWENNPHHWEYWLDMNGEPLTAMPDEYLREMVADWCGASRAYTGQWNVIEWYGKNRERIKLHPTTRARVERLIEEQSSTQRSTS